jgi:hypothetical protein
VGFLHPPCNRSTSRAVLDGTHVIGPLTRRTHYTEEPSRLSTTSAGAYVRVHGGGFVTRDMLEQTVDDLRRATREATREAGLGAMLVDLRAVAGYDSACLLAARQFLRDAPELGLQRIALVASSSVMRTASRLAAHSIAVELRTFEHELSAIHWLHPAGMVSPRPHTSSSSAAAAAP